MSTFSIAAPARHGVDHTALRVNQTAIVLTAAAAFLLDAPWLSAALCLVLAIGTAVPALALFKAFYAHVLRPAGLLRPDVRSDDPASHQFAQGVSAAVLALALGAFVLGAAIVGWILVGVVALLAAINLLAGFCVSCFIYYQLERRGFRRERRSPAS